jgi:hypothetical protein
MNTPRQNVFSRIAESAVVLRHMRSHTGQSVIHNEERQLAHGEYHLQVTPPLPQKGTSEEDGHTPPGGAAFYNACEWSRDLRYHASINRFVRDSLTRSG